MRRCLTCQQRFEPRRLICPHDKDMLIDEGTPTAEAGQVLAERYRLGNLLGEGGMGKVFEATSLVDERVVAVKLIKTDRGGSEHSRSSAEKRFQVEAEATSALDHPGFVKVFEFGRTADGASFLVLERLFGATFDELRRAGKFASVERVVELMRDVCETLALAHEKGIVHRDLKPSNLFLHRIDRDRSQVKILDFGIAKFLDKGREQLTSTGELLGTLLYMPPEQSGTQALTTAADIYTLGVILFEALAGKVPFVARSPIELLRLHASMPAPALSTFRPEVSDELEALVGRCLLKKPEHRFRNARELAAALAGMGSAMVEEASLGRTSSLLLNASYWVGLVLDERYEIQEWVAPGRYGSDVYRAVHLRSGASIAVRLWRTGKGAARDCLLEAFRREAKAMGVRHPNLLEIIDFGFTDDCVYIVTEMVDSVSLRQLLVRKGSLTPGTTSRLVRGATEALGALHAKGIVSGGLSPETIRVVSDEEGPERLILSPLGLTNLRQVNFLFRRPDGFESLDNSLDYISPEQKLGAEPDARSDIYSLGIIAAEMLGAKVRNEAESQARTITEVSSKELRAPPEEPPITLPDGISQTWMDFILRATSRDRALRPASMHEFLEALPVS